MTTRTPRILVVDDEPYIVKTLSEILGQSDYEVVTAGGGKEAISFLKNLQIDVCVLDLIMPGVSGQDVMQFINSRGIDTKVVVVSGDSHINAAISALNLRASAFLKKPFNPQELIRTVSDTLHHRKMVRRKKQLNAKIRQSERLHRYLSTRSPDLIYVLDANGYFLYLNDRIESLLGYKRNELIGIHFSEIVFPDDLALAQSTFNERRQGERATRNLQIRLQSKAEVGFNGGLCETVEVELNSIGVYSEHQIGTSRQHGSLGVIRDVSQRVANSRFERIDGHHDRLTGLPNRWLLNDRLTLALNQARRQKNRLVIMFIDLDGFKKINDTVGHRTGDRVLQQFTERLRRSLRQGDTLARYGGDEFILMLPNITSMDQAEAIANKILVSSARPFKVDSTEFKVTASIGISVFPEDGDSQELLIDRADSAMYRVKNQSKNGYFFYSDLKQANESVSVREQLLHALNHGEFVLFYQPIFDLSEQTIIGMEALLRWQHPERGLLFPGDFLPQVREAQMMQSVDDWVLSKVCRDFSDMLDAITGSIRISVNLSREKLADQGFVDWMDSVLSANRFPASSLQIEVCSKILAAADGEILQNLNSVATSGVSVLVENYDSDDLSLVQLSGIAIAGIKLDSGCFRQSGDKPGPATEKQMLATARGLGLNLIAKNIDSDQGLVQCRSMDVQSVQGFLYQHPLPLSDAKQLLRN